jgi:hypothetical protein
MEGPFPAGSGPSHFQDENGRGNVAGIKLA